MKERNTLLPIRQTTKKTCCMQLFQIMLSDQNLKSIWQNHKMIWALSKRTYHNRPSLSCMVPENIHTPTTEGHWKFQWGMGVYRPKCLTESMSLYWNFQRGGGGVQTKNPPWGEYQYFLEQHITFSLTMKKWPGALLFLQKWVLSACEWKLIFISLIPKSPHAP